MQRVLFVQRYLPRYRVPLFERLDAALKTRGSRLLLAHGQPKGEQAARWDAAEGCTWATEIEQVEIPIRGGHRFLYQRVGRLITRADVVVTELASTGLSTWASLTSSPAKTIVYGHGKNYVGPPSRLDAGVEFQMVRRAAHTMTYTEGGRRHLVARGASPDLVTAVGNSTDTRTLRRLYEASGPGERGLRDELIAHGPTALFVGGLDGSKRIPFLVDAAQAAYARDADFRLVVVGTGVDASLLDGQHPWLIRFASAGPDLLARLAWVVDAIWMPGRVGLVAVDALALGLPVLTVSHSRHAPEIEYLVREKSVYYLDDAAASYATSALAIMTVLAARRRPEARQALGDYPTVEQVAETMADVITRVTRGP